MSHRPAQADGRTSACPAANDPLLKKTSASTPSLSIPVKRYPAAVTASWMRTVASSGGFVVNACTMTWRSSLPDVRDRPDLVEGQPGRQERRLSGGRGARFRTRVLGVKDPRRSETNAKAATGIASSRS